MKKLMTNRLIALGVLLGAIGGGAVLAANAQGTMSSASRSSVAANVVSLGKTGLGSVLVDARGRTLYLFEKDRRGMSECNGACLTYWPVLTSHVAPRAGKGVNQALLGQTRAARGGARQVTYAGHPLYTFALDTRPGQTAGEGVKEFGAGGRRSPRAGGRSYGAPRPRTCPIRATARGMATEPPHDGIHAARHQQRVLLLPGRRCSR